MNPRSLPYALLYRRLRTTSTSTATLRYGRATQIRCDETATSRVSRETLGVPRPVCIWSPHFQDFARVGARGGCLSSGAEPTKASGEVSAFMELASTPTSTPRT